ALVLDEAVAGGGRSQNGRGCHVRRTSALDRERQPVRALFVLADAVGDLARMAEGRAVDAAGPVFENVDQREPDRTPYHGRCAAAVAERVEPARRVELAPHRPVQYNQNRAAAG